MARHAAHQRGMLAARIFHNWRAASSLFWRSTASAHAAPYDNQRRARRRGITARRIGTEIVDDIIGVVATRSAKHARNILAARASYRTRSALCLYRAIQAAANCGGDGKYFAAAHGMAAAAQRMAILAALRRAARASRRETSRICGISLAEVNASCSRLALTATSGNRA